MAVRRLGPIIPAAVLIILGALFLLDNLGITESESVWELAWPALIVLAGIWSFSSGHRFFGLVLSVLGLVFLGTNIGLLAEDTLSDWWPLFLIGGGLWLLLMRCRGGYRREGRTSGTDSNESVALNVVFGSADRTIVSEHFRGGSVAVKFGEADLDLRQAKLDAGGATLDASASFGEVKIRVPGTWVVSVDGAPLLGEVVDKRTSKPGEGPVLVVKATVSFGSLKIED